MGAMQGTQDTAPRKIYGQEFMAHASLEQSTMLSPVLMSTPKFLPSAVPAACRCRRLLSTSVASKPALSHSWRGMTSSAFA